MSLAQASVPMVQARQRSFYAASVPEFKAADPKAIVGQLSSRHIAFHPAAEAEQVRAWERISCAFYAQPSWNRDLRSKGSEDDATRSPSEMDETANALLAF